tara:strand:- start:774 stop:1058 length:285 start_codon:yes stop_codon:yes gene_type:complete
MIYLKWKITDGTGPEDTIFSRGGHAFAGWAVASDRYRVGYLDSAVDLSGLETWDVTELTESEALAFCQDFYADATVDSDGYITPPPDPYESLIS